MPDDAASIEAEEINTTAEERTRWGPFVLALSHPERVTRLLVLRAFCQLYVPRGMPIHRLLKLAESCSWDEIEEARLEFDRLPALTSRRILDSYARHWKYVAKREPKRGKEAADAV
jgi:hypothetical protein